MALTASRTTNGFELIGNLIPGLAIGPREYELTPNTAFSAGDMVVMTAGKVAKAAANAANVLGVMAKSYTTSDNPAADTVKGLVYDNPFNIYRCSFTDHRDSTATGGTTTTLVDSGIAGSDDDWNGALLYIYEGTNAGAVRTVKDYTAASGTFTVEEPFLAACDTTSKYILLGAAAGVINVGSVGVNLKDENTIDSNATTASEAGPLAVLAINPANLTMDVVIRKHLFNGI